MNGFGAMDEWEIEIASCECVGRSKIDGNHLSGLCRRRF